VVGGYFKAWEYENPPMEVGKEYRTTERWNGMPVYKTLVDFGTLSNTTTTISKYYTTSDNTTIIKLDSVATRTTDGFVKPIPFINNSGKVEIVIEGNASTKQVSILTLVSGLSNFTAKATVSYVKN
jgi:hypothetical protein